VKYENLDYSIRDGVASISLARPAAYNALNLEMTRELFLAAIRADEDTAVRAILVTGAGKAFCGGGDVKSFADAGAGAPAILKELTTYLHAAISRLCRARKPVITAVNGVAAGGGMSLALTGDLVLAAESARFTMAYAKIAAAPDGSSTYFLPRLIGMRRAFELYYTNRVLSAREAMEWGLVNRVHADEELAGAARALAASSRMGRRTRSAARVSCCSARRKRASRRRWSWRRKRSPRAARQATSSALSPRSPKKRRSSSRGADAAQSSRKYSTVVTTRSFLSSCCSS
jgi:2-(1,2-epoxy-1,2-dihydrophenyl)acetyl-CoA isomerase